MVYEDGYIKTFLKALHLTLITYLQVTGRPILVGSLLLLKVEM